MHAEGRYVSYRVTIINIRVACCLLRGRSAGPEVPREVPSVPFGPWSCTTGRNSRCVSRGHRTVIPQNHAGGALGKSRASWNVRSWGPGMRLLAANSARVKRARPPPALLQEWEEVLSEDRIWISVQNAFLLTTGSLC